MSYLELFFFVFFFFFKQKTAYEMRISDWSSDVCSSDLSEWIREGEYSLSAYARDLQAIASSLTTPPALVGASLGGVASLFATGSGIVSDVAALILVDIVLHPTASGVEKIRHFMARS